MKRITSLIAAGFVAALVAGPASAAGTAPSYVSSEPSDGEKLHEAPESVEVTFSEPLDESSDLTVKDSCGRTVDDGNVTVDGNTITVGIAKKPSGRYRVSYIATGLAGITGTTEGGFHFSVHLGKSCDGGSGHGDHGGKKKKGDDGHGNHGGGNQNEQEGGGGHSGHTATDGGSTNHSGSHTDSLAHSMGGSGDHSSRHDGDRHDRKGHGKGKKHGKHGKHGKHEQPTDTTAPGDDPPPVAAGDGTPTAPDGAAVMIALGFSLVLGSLGGWFLRVSGAR